MCIRDSPNGEGEAVSAAARTETGPFIVDAGHGGEDGGAVSADGTQESGINLAIALRLEDILAFCGAAPVMLRREDISLHDPEAGSLKEKKSSDLRNRTRAVQDLSGATLISVHQNSYPESRYDGAQAVSYTHLDVYKRQFQRRLEGHGVTVTVRRKLGGDIDASCGQLRRKAMAQTLGRNDGRKEADIP